MPIFRRSGNRRERRGAGSAAAGDSAAFGATATGGAAHGERPSSPDPLRHRDPLPPRSPRALLPLHAPVSPRCPRPAPSALPAPRPEVPALPAPPLELPRAFCPGRRRRRRRQGGRCGLSAPGAVATRQRGPCRGPGGTGRPCCCCSGRCWPPTSTSTSGRGLGGSWPRAHRAAHAAAAPLPPPLRRRRPPPAPPPPLPPPPPPPCCGASSPTRCTAPPPRRAPPSRCWAPAKLCATTGGRRPAGTGASRRAAPRHGTAPWAAIRGHPKPSVPSPGASSLCAYARVPSPGHPSPGIHSRIPSPGTHPQIPISDHPISGQPKPSTPSTAPRS